MAVSSMLCALLVVIGFFTLCQSLHMRTEIGASAEAEWSKPRTIIAHKAYAPLTLDGDIYKDAWEAVPWSEDFVDIQGDDAPSSNRPTSDTRTRVKILWDDNYLYIAAEMTAHNWAIVADNTQRNSAIFHTDSDIEVFLDTDGSASNYKELEMNAQNTVWNLYMDKPYAAGGREHSGRVASAGPNYWDVNGQKTVARIYGHLDIDNPEGKWTAEIALKHEDSLNFTRGLAPAVGKFWRINFARVERSGKYNWAWTPQKVWSPQDKKYKGTVDMHIPEAWGYVFFAPAISSIWNVKTDPASWTDPQGDLKAAAWQVFYAESLACSGEGGNTLLNFTSLLQKGWLNATTFQGMDVAITGNCEQSHGVNATWWAADVRDNFGCTASVREDHSIMVKCEQSRMHVGMSVLTVLLLVTMGVAAFTYFVPHKKGLSRLSWPEYGAASIAAIAVQQGLVAAVKQARCTLGFCSRPFVEEADADGPDGKMQQAVRSSARQAGVLLEFNADADVATIGLIFECLPPKRPVVKEVHSGTWAHEVGVTPGDEILRIGGRDVEGMQREEFVEAMGSRPLVLKISRRPLLLF